LGQVVILTKTLFFEYFLLDQLQTWCESSTWSATQVISFDGRLPMTLIVSTRVKNGIPRGQILKLQKPYLVVSRMKALDKHSPEQ
jgi:hypothetical protein